MQATSAVTYGICALLTLPEHSQKGRIHASLRHCISVPHLRSKSFGVSSREEVDLYFHTFDFVFVFWYSASGEESLRAQPVFNFKEGGSNQMSNKVKWGKVSEVIRQGTHMFVYNMSLLQCGQEPHLLNEKSLM